MKSWKMFFVMLMAFVMFCTTPVSILAELADASAAEVQNDAEPVTEIVESIPEATESVPEVEEVSVTEEIPVDEEVPVDEDVPIVEDMPVVEETPVGEQMPVLEIIPETIEEEVTFVTEPTQVVAEQVLYAPTGTIVSTQDAAVTASYSMFKVAEAAKVNTYSDGTMTAVITYTGSSFLKMYLGSAEAAETATEGFVEAKYVAEKEYTYEIPLSAFDTPINAAVLSSKGSWKDNTLTVSLTKTEEPEKPEAPALVNTQNVKVTASYSMFKVAEDAKLYTYSDGTMAAEVIYTGSSFLKMYLGSAAKAETATEGIIEAQYVAEKEYTYLIPVTDITNPIDAAVLSSKGSWKDNTLTFTLPEVTPEPTPEPTPKPTPEPAPTAPTDGKYTVSVETGASMFKVVQAVLTVKNGQMTAVITLSGTGYDYLYMGTAADAANAAEADKIPAVVNAEGQYTYEIPVSALDTAISVAAHASKSDKWFDRTLTFSSTTLEKQVYIPADGTYSATAETGAAMFKVVDCVLTVKNGQMTAVIALSGTGYDYLYMGTAADAANAKDAEKIPFVIKPINGEDKYTYEIPVNALDEAIAIASHSSKNDKWFDRTITIASASLKAVSVEPLPEVPGTPTPIPTPIPTPTPDAGITDEEELENMIENTKPGEVKDGTYKPSFGYKGGTGRVTLSCNKVVVKDGKATATVVFSSPNFTYAKVNGVKYYNQNKGGNSTFVIPVNLNGTTRIAAETTAMSTPYEVEYTLYVYVDGTDVSGIKTPTKTDDAKEEEEKTDEELTDESTLEETKEENGWGAFDSEQTADAEDKTTGAADVEETVAASVESAESEGSSMLIPIIILVAAVIGISAVLVRAYVTSKRK